MQVQRLVLLANVKGYHVLVCSVIVLRTPTLKKMEWQSMVEKTWWFCLHHAVQLSIFHRKIRSVAPPQGTCLMTLYWEMHRLRVRERREKPSTRRNFYRHPLDRDKAPPTSSLAGRGGFQCPFQHFPSAWTGLNRQCCESFTASSRSLLGSQCTKESKKHYCATCANKNVLKLTLGHFFKSMKLANPSLSPLAWNLKGQVPVTPLAH